MFALVPFRVRLLEVVPLPSVVISPPLVPSGSNFMMDTPLVPSTR